MTRSLDRFFSLSRSLVVVFAALYSSGCYVGKEQRQSTRDSTHNTAVEIAANIDGMIGIWTVTGHSSPGISAMSDADAKSWYGQSVRLMPDEALSPTHHCDRPIYSVREANADRYLSVNFKTSTRAISALASQSPVRSQLQLQELSCDGVPWSALGGLLIKLDSVHALAPWNGVFFELTRDKDLRALGQEPFWNLQIRKGKDVRFTNVAGNSVTVAPYPLPSVLADGAVVYDASTEANDLRVTVERVPCSDVMSGKPFPATVTVTLKGTTYRGCGENIE